jgi:ferredoxin
MKVVIDWDLCQGHANCTGDAPEVFQLDEDGKLLLLNEFPDPSLRAGVEDAVKYCPSRAISIQE